MREVHCEHNVTRLRRRLSGAIFKHLVSSKTRYGRKTPDHVNKPLGFCIEVCARSPNQALEKLKVSGYNQVMDEATRNEVTLYIENADESLSVAQLNLDNDFYAAAINRAYYAIFYAANALLATRKLARSKHSGVLATFRQTFIKSGLLATELSEIYGQVLEDRHEGDYEIITATSQEDAVLDLQQARYFVTEVKAWLRKERWL